MLIKKKRRQNRLSYLNQLLYECHTSFSRYTSNHKIRRMSLFGYLRIINIHIKKALFIHFKTEAVLTSCVEENNNNNSCYLLI